ncbi:hypothetical protein FPQ18DRAFT_387219 [Pyronema domesticum]|uniref:Uncharacterized protein n=1 Tax=Pyronema omphalodes (strain CBS 100304) TaxID=1076935 RepID=U4KYR0_PYROM|nr:hypothetical protein FPQ18DRAFT_387219 [Pyronema domesticum]CCX06800.1 Protein of unknown function [Pyronema omphalodes CBS 100304]
MHTRTPAWVIIGLLTSFLILLLQILLFLHESTVYAAFIVSLTYTTSLFLTCLCMFLSHQLVRRYPKLSRFLNVGIDLASVMTRGRRGGRNDGDMIEGIRGGNGEGLVGGRKSLPRGRNRQSIGIWVTNSAATAEPDTQQVEEVRRPEVARTTDSLERMRRGSDTSSEEAEWRERNRGFVSPA